ncbi:MAG: hypothetical protein R3F49_22260 [Planctomycetota bacterium]
MTPGDAFYIGWEPRAAAPLGRFVRARVAALLLAVACLGAALAASQAPFPASRFEFGVARTFTGRVEHVPYPTLVVERPGATTTHSRYLLTVFGKRGAEAVTAPLEGHNVRFQGSLIHRDSVTMIELAPDSLEDLGPSVTQGAAQGAARGLGEGAARAPEQRLRLAGEIVDSKCFLGVMKPGNLKTHRACAVRCISGGVPPVLLVRDDEGRATYYLLVDEQGGAVNARVLDLVAEPVTIEGRVVTRDGLAILYADPASYTRR